MIKNKHNAISIIVILVFGLSLFYFGTDGFTAFTEETARTNKLIKTAPKFPEVTLEDSMGQVYPFSEFTGKYVMMTFIYTACTDVCPKLEKNLAEVYESVPEQYIGNDIVFLSISFDPIRDNPETLDKYRLMFNSDGETWRMARITDHDELEHLLKEFGVIVIPDGEGDFAHNSAFYLVNPDGYLIDVMDYTDIKSASIIVNDILANEVGD